MHNAAIINAYARPRECRRAPYMEGGTRGCQLPKRLRTCFQRNDILSSTPRSARARIAWQRACERSQQCRIYISVKLLGRAVQECTKRSSTARAAAHPGRPRTDADVRTDAEPGRPLPPLELPKKGNSYHRGSNPSYLVNYI